MGKGKKKVLPIEISQENFSLLDIYKDTTSSTEANQLPLDRAEDFIEDVPLLGKGSSGIVKGMIYTPSSLKLAVKVILLPNEDSFLNIQRELEINAKVSHENIVPYYGCRVESDYYYLYFARMDLSLADYLHRKGTCTDIELQYICYHVVQGLTYLSKSCHMIHRDVKPSNIMLNIKGDVKLSDFGIARELKDTLGLAKTFIGTFCYMDPQRLDGEAFSSNCDVWSLGLVLLECLLGHHPIISASTPEPSYFEIVQRMNQFNPRDLLVHHPASPACKSFIQQCLILDPAQRPFAHDLLQSPLLANYTPSFNPLSF